MLQSCHTQTALDANGRRTGGRCGGLRLPRLIRRPLSCLLGGGESTLGSTWAAAGLPGGSGGVIRQDSWSFRRSLQVNQLLESQPALAANDNNRICCGRTEQRTVVLNRSGPSFGFSLIGSQPVRVGRVELHSAAEAGGLRVGDAIVWAGGHMVLNSDCETLVRRIRSGGSRLELRIQRWLSNCSSCSESDAPERGAHELGFEADEEESDASSSLELSSLYRATEGAQPIRAAQRPQSLYYPFRPLASQPITAMNPEQARLYPPVDANQIGFQPVRQAGCQPNEGMEQGFQPIRSQECRQPLTRLESSQPIRSHDLQQPIESREIRQPIRSQVLQQPIMSQVSNRPIRATGEYRTSIRNEQHTLQLIRSQEFHQPMTASGQKGFQPNRKSVQRPQPIRSQESQPQRGWLRQQSYLQATGACQAASAEPSDSSSPRASPGGQSSSSGVSSTAAATAAVNAPTPSDILDAGSPILSSRLQWHRQRPGGCRAQALLLPRLLMLARLDSVEGDGEIRDVDQTSGNDVGVFRLADCVRAEFDFPHNSRLIRLTFRRRDGEERAAGCALRRIILEAPCGLVKERWRRCLQPLLLGDGEKNQEKPSAPMTAATVEAR